ncbi:hypothetical protein [Aeribacillus pallidus]|uniref:hypothetical protein n=1 Tax=Aeribacillus pallidus TaxID=33936 RepID=UPI003D25174F
MAENKTITPLAHRELAAQYFNNVWDLLEKENRTEEDNQRMVHLCHASFLHWTEIENHTAEHLSIGYWQLSRVYVTIGKPEIALEYAKKCIEISEKGGLTPFYLGYAFEALARAYYQLHLIPEAKAAFETAYSLAKQVEPSDHQELLIKDLETMM